MTTRQFTEEHALLLPEIKAIMLDAAVDYYRENGHFQKSDAENAPPELCDFLKCDEHMRKARGMSGYRVYLHAGRYGLCREIYISIMPEHTDGKPENYLTAIYVTEDGVFVASPLLIYEQKSYPLKPLWNGNGYNYPGVKTLESSLSYARLINDVFV